MSDPTWALQKAIYAALDAALAIPVHDMGAIPAGAAMPYVAIGPIQASGDDRLATLADRTLVYLTAWTDYGGQKQALEYVATIYGALHRARLTLETGRLVRACRAPRDRGRPERRDLQGHRLGAVPRRALTASTRP